MARERIEDIGRILVLIENLLGHDLFEKKQSWPRNKDFSDWFNGEIDDEKRDDIARGMAYGLDEIKDKLYEILEIAKGHDYLNEQSESIWEKIFCKAALH